MRIIVEHLNRLAARGHTCTLISTNGQPVNWLRCNFEQRPLDDPGAGYDVIVGTAVPTWPVAVELSKGNGKVAGLLQMADWLFSTVGSPEYQQCMAQFQAPVEVLAISEWLAALAETVPNRTVYRIRNGIDPHLFYHEDSPDVPPFDGLTIVTEGYSHNPAKDVDEYFKRAIRHLRWDKGYKLRTHGFSQFDPTFEYDAYWKAPAQDLIRRIYSTGDIFLKASRYEGRPGPHMEAMACGAVVCTAIGTGDDDLIDEDNCLKVGYGNYDGFVANFQRLCDDMPLRARLKENALKYVLDKYDWPTAIDMVEKALTGSVTVPDPVKQAAYNLSEYDPMQQAIVEWETPQAMFLGELLTDLLHPESVIDIGCGPGVYLTPFKPWAKVLGVDGAPEAGKALEPEEFSIADLRDDWHLPLDLKLNGDTVDTDRYSLSLCIETAEHLPPDRADYLVDLLTTCSDVCFFSAAQPGQGGTLHLNEQPKAYWLEKFKARGFDLHPKNEYLEKQIAANWHCQRIRWLIGNSMLLGRKDNGRIAGSTPN